MNLFFHSIYPTIQPNRFLSKNESDSAQTWVDEWKHRFETSLSMWKKTFQKLFFTTNGKPGFEVYGILAVIIIMSYSENVSVIK